MTHGVKSADVTNPITKRIRIKMNTRNRYEPETGIKILINIRVQLQNSINLHFFYKPCSRKLQ